MQATWLHRQGSENLILFYAGWALDTSGLQHLASSCDVLMLHDYRDETFEPDWVAAYTFVDVIAYSMGVAVAGRHLSKHPMRSALAICGTPTPRKSIGTDIYDQTAAQLSVKSLAKFARRAGALPPSAPNIEALRMELQCLAERAVADQSAFNRIIACREDRIFTQSSITQAWPCHKITWNQGPHMPFAKWQSWQEIMT